MAKINRDRQFSLFDHPTRTASKASQESLVSRRFIDPDPSEIFIGTASLEQHLKDMRIQDPFIVRRVLRDLDFSEFENRYDALGRPPFAPASISGVILYGLMHGVTSLRDLERFARADLGCMWVSGGITPDHSVLGRFIQRHSLELQEVLFGAVVSAALTHTQSGRDQVAGDGTVIEAMSSRYGLLSQEAAEHRLSELDGEVERTAEAEQEREQLSTMVETLKGRQSDNGGRGHQTLNPDEPDAVVLKQKGSNSYRSSYAPTVLANDARVVVDAELDGKSEQSALETMLERDEEIEELLVDANFRSESVLETSVSRDINVLAPAAGGERGKKPSKLIDLDRFHYDEARDVYVCPENQELKLSARYRKAKRMRYTSTACRRCPLKSSCTKGKQRYIERTRSSELREGLKRVMAQPQAMRRYRQRKAMVEPVFAVLRDRQGLNRFRRRGKQGARIEFRLHIMAYNLSRVVARLVSAIFARLRGRLSANTRRLGRRLADCIGVGRFRGNVPTLGIAA